MRSWHLFWLYWFLCWFSVFLVAEIYALCTDWRRTLSAAVWNFERFVPGQSVWKWSAGHLLFCGVMVLVFVWLTGHFALGLWR